jgi:hypothetical protein
MIQFPTHYFMLLKKIKFNLVVLALFLMQTVAIVITMTYVTHAPQIDVWKIATDIGQYYSKVKPVLDGSLAFNRMPLEYPVGAFPLMAIPALFASNMDQYLVPFVLEMIIWNAALFFMVVRWAKREHGQRFALQSAVWYALWMLLFTPTWALRIDVPAATLIFASFTWLITRPGLSALIGVLGGYIKLVPLVTVLAAIRQRRSIKTPLIAGGIFLFILATWWVAAGPSMEYAIRYHFQRGIEIGSLYSGALYIVGKIAHWSMYSEMRFASLELITPVPQAILKCIPILQALAVAYPLLRQRQGTQAGNLRLVTAMVLGYVVFGKVLSPQYMIWLVPLYAVVAGSLARKQKIIFSVACVATTILYPIRFLSLVQLAPVMMVVLNVRNILLVWLYWLATRPETTITNNNSPINSIINRPSQRVPKSKPNI